MLSFTGELKEFGPDPTGEGLYLKVVEATNEQNPPPVESDIFEIWYSLPHGLTLPVTLDERIQAEVAIDASGSATRVGLWLFSAPPQDRQVIFGSEVHPAGAGLPLGEDHPFLASATASQETVCEEATALQCSGARSTTVEFVPREGLELEDADSTPWRMWPGAEVTITDPLEPKPLTPWYVLGLSSAWAFDEDSDCPDAGLGTSFSWWVVNEGYETFE